MTRTLCLVVFGFMMSLGHALQQPDQGASREASPAAQTATQTTQATPAPSSTGSATVSPSPTEALAIDSALETQIQDALRKDPALGSGSVRVTALPDGIELSGTVANGRERQNAGRIAQSYARGKKVLNHILVNGRSTQPGASSVENHPANFSGPARDSGPHKNSPP